MIIPVILSGGTGSRLWPLSRESYPKQFLPLTGKQSLLQDTVARVMQVPDTTPPLVVCNQEHRYMVAEQLRLLGITPTAVILEPVGRNTAPAATLAALYALEMETEQDPILLLLPADHVIADADGFRQAMEKALPHAQDGHLLTFGIVPQSPEIGYGYIKAGAALAESGIYRVDRFVEKPDQAAAQSYVESGDYYWNSGMFMFRASRFLQELQRLAPEILDACRQAWPGEHSDLDFLRLDRDAFQACPSDSIDYAVMEKTDDALVMPLNVAWNDVGSWAALWEVGEQDANGNVLNGDVLPLDTRKTYVHAQDRLVATIGVENLVIVETADAVLVANKDNVQTVRTIVEQLKKEDREEGRAHRKIYRPWGCYDSIDSEERFKVKRITVNPGAQISLQTHHHRAEHWIVVKGTARVTCGDEEFLLTENQSTYIPLGTCHRLENPGKIPLELIEVQSGSYLGEDDIVRFEDIYGRHND